MRRSSSTQSVVSQEKAIRCASTFKVYLKIVISQCLIYNSSTVLKSKFGVDAIEYEGTGGLWMKGLLLLFGGDEMAVH